MSLSAPRRGQMELFTFDLERLRLRVIPAEVCLKVARRYLDEACLTEIILLLGAAECTVYS